LKHMKKLNDEDVFEIKKLLREGRAQKTLAGSFSVSPATISRIKRGILHKKIICPSEEYNKGYQEGYRKGFQDSKKFETLEQAERPQFIAHKVAHKRGKSDN
jgi:IS30 family transposase